MGTGLGAHQSTAEDYGATSTVGEGAGAAVDATAATVATHMHSAYHSGITMTTLQNRCVESSLASLPPEPEHVHHETMDKERRHRHGHKCCGRTRRGCDMRRAVVFINQVAFFTFLFAFHGLFSDPEPNAWDEMNVINREFIEELNETFVDHWTWYPVVQIVAGIVASVLGLVGAAQFNAHYVAVAGCFYSIMGVVQLAQALQLFYKGNGGGATAHLMFMLYCGGGPAYPHWVFVAEVRRGIVSRDTYAEMEQESSCCCA
jgi:hypothetical protein